MRQNQSKRCVETLAAQGLGWIEEYAKSVTPAIYPSTTFIRNPDLTYHQGRKYARADNPTYDQTAALVAALEVGVHAQLFASGMAAIGAVFTALNPGEHIVVGAGVYGGTRTYLERIAAPWGLDVTQLTENSPESLNKAIMPGKTRIVWIETPSNPLWTLTDIQASSDIAHQHNVTVVVDNTVATPVLTRTIEHGADIVMHSATKYLNGHGDLLLGILITKKEEAFWERILDIAHDGGAIPGAFDSWLLLRGMRTLFIRMERICANAQRIAEFLSKHPKVTRVHYPGLPEHAGYDIAPPALEP